MFGAFLGHDKLLKLITALFIWIATFLGVILPLCFPSFRTVNYSASLTGGVFIGAGIAHLFTDSIDELSVTKYGTLIAASILLLSYILFTAIEVFAYGEHDHVFKEDKHRHDGLKYTSNIVPDNRYNTDSLSSNYRTIDSTAILIRKSSFGDKVYKLNVAATFLYIIMNFHSCIEGMALGVSSGKSAVLGIFIPIVAHKPLEAFALSFTILRCKPSKILFWILMVIYTLFTPAVIILCAFLFSGNDKKEYKIAKGSILAFSSGTFLFVGTHEWSEIIVHKHDRSVRQNIVSFVLFSLCIFLMVGLAFLENCLDH